MTNTPSRSELIDELRRVANALGETPTAAQINAKADYSSYQYQTEFGRWNTALREAGFEVNQSRATEWSESDLSDDLQRVANIVGRTPRRGDVDEHGEWDVTTYQERLPDNNGKSRWNDVLDFAGFTSYYEIRETFTKLCAECGAEMELKTYETGRKFCSRDCFAADRSGRFAGKDSPNYQSKRVECASCGAELIRAPWRRENRDNHFCDHDCYGDWLSENMVQENHPNWVESPSNVVYGRGWNEEKKECVRDRDNRRCQVCGKTEQEELEDVGWRLSVHHIVPARKIDNPDERNAMDNLVTLCVEHHRKWEGIPLRPQLIGSEGV